MDSVIDIIRVLSDMLYVVLRVGLVFGVILIGVCALGLYEGVVWIRSWAAKHKSRPVERILG